MSDLPQSELRICEHCHNKGRMQIISEHTEDLGYGDEDDEGNPYWVNEGQHVYRLLRCEGCEKLVLARGYRYHDDDQMRKPFTALYPPPAEIPATIPDKVKSVLDEAKRVRNVSANSFGVLAGRAIERICADKGCTERTLEKSIEELAKRNEIPERLSKLAHQLRAIRNFGAHGGEADLTEAEVPVAEMILQAIVEYIYVLPELLKTAEEAVRNLKK